MVSTQIRQASLPSSILPRPESSLSWTRSSAWALMFWIKCLVGGAVLGYAGWHFEILNAFTGGELRNSVGVVAQIAATMLGFVLAALAILLTIAGTRLLRNMQRTGHYGHLLSRMLG